MVAPSAHANLIVDGSFESPVIADGNFSLFASIPGWSLVSGPSIEIQRHVAGTPADGRQFVELDIAGRVPEPGSVLLLATALLMLGVARRRQRVR